MLARELAADRVTERDFARKKLTADEIRALITAAGGVSAVLSPRNATARDRGWTVATAPDVDTFVAAAVEDNNLLRRPILVVAAGNKGAAPTVVVGNALDAYRTLLG